MEKCLDLVEKHLPSQSKSDLSRKIKEYYMLKNGLDRKMIDQEIMERLRRI